MISNRKDAPCSLREDGIDYLETNLFRDFKNVNSPFDWPIFTLTRSNSDKLPFSKFSQQQKQDACT